MIIRRKLLLVTAVFMVAVLNVGAVVSAAARWKESCGLSLIK